MPLHIVVKIGKQVSMQTNEPDLILSWNTTSRVSSDSLPYPFDLPQPPLRPREEGTD